MDIHSLKIKAQHHRQTVIKTIYHHGRGHIGGALSAIDILTALFYSGYLTFHPEQPDWPQRDRFILSKGHAAIALYAILSDLGFFSKKELSLFNTPHGILGEHPDINIPGIEVNAGSLGHGLGIASGMALAAKIDNDQYKVVTLLGDGECYEGSIWESALYAAHQKLNNLIAIVDRNGLCVHDNTEDANALEPFADKWRSFGWHVLVINGHDYQAILNTLNHVPTDTRPTLIIAKTIKGKGISFMENQASWHHGSLSDKQYQQALMELA